jgi:hypothetical protein
LEVKKVIFCSFQIKAKQHKFEAKQAMRNKSVKQNDAKNIWKRKVKFKEKLTVFSLEETKNSFWFQNEKCEGNN